MVAEDSGHRGTKLSGGLPHTFCQTCFDLRSSTANLNLVNDCLVPLPYHTLRVPLYRSVRYYLQPLYGFSISSRCKLLETLGFLPSSSSIGTFLKPNLARPLRLGDLVTIGIMDVAHHVEEARFCSCNGLILCYPLHPNRNCISQSDHPKTKSESFFNVLMMHEEHSKLAFLFD